MKRLNSASLVIVATLIIFYGRGLVRSMLISRSGACVQAKVVDYGESGLVEENKDEIRVTWYDGGKPRLVALDWGSLDSFFYGSKPKINDMIEICYPKGWISAAATRRMHEHDLYFGPFALAAAAVLAFFFYKTRKLE